MVALASPVMWRDAEQMHALVLRQLLDAKRQRGVRVLIESLAEEAHQLVRHILHRGVPEHLDLLADAAADVLEHGTAKRLLSSQRAHAKQVLRAACQAMRQTGIDGHPLDHIVQLARLSARMPRLQSCYQAHLEVLAAPITKLLLELFGS